MREIATSGRGQRDIALDRMRATAIGLLLLAHGVAIFYTVFPEQRLFWFFGCWGMDLSFVLGGYLLVRQLVSNEDTAIGVVFAERARRILPNYVLFVLIGVLLAWMADGQLRTPLRYWLFVQNLYGPHPSFLPELWGLATGVSTGALLLLGHVLMQRRYGRAGSVCLLAFWILAANLLRVWHVLADDPSWDEQVKKVSLWRLDALAYGMLAAHLRDAAWWPRVSRTALAAFGAGVLLLVLIMYAMVDENHSVLARTLLFTADGVAFSALLLAVVDCEPTRHARESNGTVRGLARVSYALFLCHLPVLRLFAFADFSRDRWLVCVVQFIAFVVVSVLFATLVERFWERRWWQPRAGYSGR